ncbi:MAG: nuclear transport factor 2 family protein [Sphingomonas sp.]|uniref:nuclear transport factor 2 family protein n=1 Tax=Sphingomonas sp. TaxID=28214 RepID=UPI0025DAE3BD|nr:nuclear transport factor 2 family protein [Sphingomonas sp.]MBX3565812.1 nuclear transport factor 2 family protein [Sphingomonas sp.]
MTPLLALALIADDPNAEILRAADAFDAAQLTQDRAAMDKLVDDGLIFIDGSGKRQGKTDFIEGWMNQGDKYDPLVLVDRTITLLGPDAAVVSAETELTGESGGKRFASRFRYSDVFRRVGDVWRAVLIQVTRIPPKSGG